MKRFIVAGIVFIMSLFISTLAHTEDTFKIATGKEKGIYNSVAGPTLTRFLSKNFPKVELVQTNGSKENLDLLVNNKVDAAFVQFDALLAFGSNANVVLVGELYPETVHLLTNADGPKNIKAIDKKTGKIAIGEPGGGASVTWSAFVKTDTDYKDIATVPVGGSRALSELQARHVDAILIIGGIGHGDVMRANSTPGIKLSDVNDGAFDNPKYQDKKIYRFADISKKQYPGLIGFFDVKTLQVPAMFVVNAEWADRNPKLYDILFDATNSAIPLIRQTVAK